nr:MFS transporter permease [Micromonospora sp. DSM 115978]
MAGPVTAATRWLTRPVPRGRVAAFRTLIYLFVAADLLVFTPWIRDPARVAGELYQPLFVGRLLPLPTPTPLLISLLFWALLALSLAAATGRAPRALGWPVFVLYFEWMIVAMSYGKVDHDRFAFLVALAVLPTAGRARHGDPVRTEAGGWAFRVTQIAVVCTYFLAAWAKLRFGGIEWVTGSVLARAIIRRGTELADLIAQVPYLLIAAQLGIVAFELLSPLVFALSGRWRRAAIGFFYSFHLVTFSTITISFAPHLVAMTAFLPLERIRPIHWLRRRARRDGGGRSEPALRVRQPVGEAAGGVGTGGPPQTAEPVA